MSLSSSCLIKPRVWPCCSISDSDLPIVSVSTRRRSRLMFVMESPSTQGFSSRCVHATLNRETGSGSHAPNIWGWWCRPTGVIPSGTLKLRFSTGSAESSSCEIPSANVHVRRHCPLSVLDDATNFSELCCLTFPSGLEHRDNEEPPDGAQDVLRGRESS